MSRSLKSCTVLLAASLVLVGCSGESDPARSTSATSSDATPTSSDTATPGTEESTAADDPQTIAGTGYSYEVPDGWGDPEQDIPGFDFDTLAVDLGDDDGFADNLNVVLSQAGGLPLDTIEESAVTELETAGATDVTVLDRRTIAGEEALHLSSVMNQNGVDYQIE
ncbi:MAG: hypothetical protein ACTMIR_16080 [Cellulomonadaceae bacterium]